MCRQGAAQTILTTSYLNRLVFNIVVRLGAHFFALNVTNTTLWIEISLCLIKISWCSVASAVRGTRLLVALGWRVHDEIVLVLLGNRRLSLVHHDEVIDGTWRLLLLSGASTISSLWDDHIWCNGLVWNLDRSYRRSHIHRLQRRHFMRSSLRPADLKVKMLHGCANIDCLVDSSLVWRATSGRWNDLILVIFPGRILGELTVSGRFISPWEGSLFSFSILLKLRDNLHRVWLLCLRALWFAVSSDRSSVCQLWVEKIALCWSHLWILTLHLNLLLDLGRYLTGRRVNSTWTRPAVTYAVRLSLLQIHWRAIMLRGSLTEEIILVGRRLKMLMSSSLHILSSRNLYLNIRPVSYLFLNCLLLPCRAIKILCCLIHNLVRRGTSYCKINLLCWAAPCWPRATFRGIMSVALNTFNQLTCLRVNFGEWINSVVLVSGMVSKGSIIWNTALNESAVTSSTFCISRNIMQIDLATATVILYASRIVEHWLSLLEAAINRWVHRLIDWAGHLWSYVVSTFVIRLVLTAIRSRRRASGILFRKHSARVHWGFAAFSVDWWSQRRVAIYHVNLECERRIVCSCSSLTILHCLLALDYDGRFFNINNIDRIDRLRFVWNPFDVLWRDNCHSLDDPELLLLLLLLLLIIALSACLLRLCGGRCHGSGWFLDDTFSASSWSLLKSTCSGTIVHLLLLLGLLLRTTDIGLDWSRSISLRNLGRLVSRLPLCGRGRCFGVLHWRGRGTFLASSKKLFNILVVLLAEHACTFLAF